MKHDVTIHFDDGDFAGLNKKLDQIIRALEADKKRDTQMAQNLEELATDVQENTDATSSILSVLEGVNQQLKDALATGDVAKIQELSDQIDANTQRLTDAAVANTGAA